MRLLAFSPKNKLLSVCRCVISMMSLSVSIFVSSGRRNTMLAMTLQWALFTSSLLLDDDARKAYYVTRFIVSHHRKQWLIPIDSPGIISYSQAVVCRYVCQAEKVLVKFELVHARLDMAARPSKRGCHASGVAK